MTMSNGEIQVRVAGWMVKGQCLKIDGRLGPRTSAAVKRFQAGYGLARTGTVNAQTERKLRALGQPNAFPIHFYLNEFKTKSGEGFSGGKVASKTVRRNVRRLAWKLEAMRRKSGDKVTWVNSAFRSIAHNNRVGGSGDSKHLYGIAADVTIKGLSVSRMAALSYSSGFSGVIKYPTHVHVDSRAEYTYGSSGWYLP